MLDCAGRISDTSDMLRLLVCCSLELKNASQTLSTLRFAKRAKRCAARIVVARRHADLVLTLAPP